MDLQFAALLIGTMGPYVDSWRKQQVKAIRHILKAFAKVDERIIEKMHPHVKAVSWDKRPAAMAALGVILRWPDRTLAREFIYGFKVVDSTASSGVFREIQSERPDGFDINKDFFGKPAEIFVLNLIGDEPPAESEEIEELIEKDLAKGRLHSPGSAKDMNDRFGPGKWRPMPSFRVIQGSGKRRLISDAKRGGHNSATFAEETIYTPSVDVMAESCRLLFRAISEGPWCNYQDQGKSESSGGLPPWAEMVASTEDLDDAYGKCPGHPDHRGACVVAWYSVKNSEWRFAEATGLTFGLSSAVLSFNRWPALMLAAARRLVALLSSNYFDDFVTTDVKIAARAGREALIACAEACGATFGEPKAIPPGQHRTFTGVVVHLDYVASEGIIAMNPKQECIDSIVGEATERLQEARCTSTQASKIRGKCGWVGSNSFAKIGRIGLAALKQRQYWDKSSAITEGGQLYDALVLLRDFFPVIPPRTIDLLKVQSPPIVVYSDAAWPSDEDGEKKKVIPRIGWVIFQPGKRPVGYSFVVNESITSHLIQREQQITALEAFAPIAALETSPEIFANSESLWFVDNEGAVSSLIRGAAKVEDIDLVAALTTVQAASLKSQIWYEWIDSKSNPADGLSRDGVEDEWTMKQGWELHDLGSPNWSHVFSEGYWGRLLTNVAAE